MALPFIKMQATGNDLIIIDDLAKPVTTFHTATPEVAKKICDRRFGIGADQILWLREPSQENADAEMVILNSDGSTAEMCGNGLRAVGIYLHRHGTKPYQPTYTIQTAAGLQTVEVRATEIAVNMGVPELAAKSESLTAQGKTFEFTRVSFGNPHAVMFVDDLSKIDLPVIGPEIEKHALFPKKTNVEFVQVIDPHTIRAKIWERGAGATLACGSGACASAVVALERGKVKSPVKVELPGGVLTISWDGKGKPVTKAGAAQEVFRGELVIDL